MTNFNQQGLFSGLGFSTDDEESLIREREMRYAAQDPGTRAVADSYMAGRGLSQAIGGALGADVRTPGVKNRDSVEQIKAAVAQSGVQPGSDEYYQLLIAQFTQHGMLDAANAATQAWEQIKRQRAQTKHYEAQAAKAERVSPRDALTERYWQTVEQIQNQGEFQDPNLIQARNNLARALGIKPEPQESADWQVVNATQYSPGYKINRRTGETVALDGRIAKPSAEQAGGPASRPIKQEGQRDGRGNQIYTDKNGDNWILRGNRWVEPEGPMQSEERVSPEQDRSNTSTLPATARGNIASYDEMGRVTVQAWNAFASAPTSTGVEGYIPEMFREWFSSPAARQARAAISNIGSTFLKLRSGAAVTDKEFQRLEALIPSATTTDVAVKDKLQALYAAIVAGGNSTRAANNLPELDYPELTEAPTAPAATRRPQERAPRQPNGGNPTRRTGDRVEWERGPDGRPRRKR